MDLIVAARQTAWTPDYLTSPKQFEQMSPERRWSESHFEEYPVRSQFVNGDAFIYVIGDPTEDTEPNLKERLVIVWQGPNDEVLTEVLTAPGFFPRLFRLNSGFDPSATEMYDWCRLYVTLFGGNCITFSKPKVLFTAKDIPVDPDTLLQEDVSKIITPPVRAHGIADDVPDKLVITFDCSLFTWDLNGGVIKKWIFNLRHHYDDGTKSTASISETIVRDMVGQVEAPR